MAQQVGQLIAREILSCIRYSSEDSGKIRGCTLLVNSTYDMGVVYGTT